MSTGSEHTGGVPHLELRGITKILGGKTVLNDINLEVARADLLGMLGPSGSGKTTILNIIGGFLAPDEGSVRIGGEDVVDLAPYHRDIGITFQGYALFPHMSVFDNVAYGLKQRKVDRDEIGQRVRRMLAMLGLGDFEKRYPKELSGGEQQRVALARSLVVRPRLMLLDEPLANLDASLRQRVRFDIRDILRQTQVTSIFVTHDQDEAFALCDRVAVLHGGRIQQLGTPAEILDSPANAFVAGFIGCPNIFAATVKAYRPGERLATVVKDDFECEVGCRLPVREGDGVTVFVRPEEVTFTPCDRQGFAVRDWVHLGSGRELWVEGPVALRGRLPADEPTPGRGTAVRPCWMPQRAHAFADAGPFGIGS